MSILILVRHGRSTANAAGILAGRADGVDLDEVGRRQATSLADVLRDVRHAYTSPIARCRQTAELAGFPGATVLDGLSECDYGDWTGSKLEALATEALWARVQAEPSAVEFPGGETMLAMRERTVAAVAGIVESHAGEPAVAFTHGDPIKAIIADALAVPFDEFQRLDVPPGSASIIDFSRPKPLVRLVGGAVDPRPSFLVSKPATVGGSVG
ncbi:MAG: histidine phosphatase [Propionibacterium sp.]|nr:histidine phosphatase [Propionibacterium sp.]